MSEVMLHGYPVKVGDKVWHFVDGWIEVEKLDNDAVLGKDSSWYHVLSLFWQPIDPAAIKAAKVKPKEPVYEWQWIFRHRSGVIHLTSCHYKSKDHAQQAMIALGEVLCAVEESKRESLSL